MFILFTLAIPALCADDQIPLPGTGASLTLAKTNYLIGEPIVLVFTAKYTGKGKPAYLTHTSPYGTCSPYHLTVAPESPDIAPPGPPCAPFFQLIDINCLFGAMQYDSQKEAEERVLLNILHPFARPGIYTVQVTRTMSFASELKKKNQPHGRVSATFTLNLTAPGSVDDLKPAFAAYVQDVQDNASSSAAGRYEAAAALSTLAIPFLESSLIGMISLPDLQNQAIEGLGRIDTAGARAALFSFLERGKGSEFEEGLAAKQLEKSADTDYGPKLLSLWLARPAATRPGYLLAAAARLTPDLTRPAIDDCLTSLDMKQRRSGTIALAAAEQPWALPILVRMLNDVSSYVRNGAAEGLVHLTRESPSAQLFESGNPAADRLYWSQWLNNHRDLPIHLLRACPEYDRPRRL